MRTVWGEEFVRIFGSAPLGSLDEELLVSNGSWQPVEWFAEDAGDVLRRLYWANSMGLFDFLSRPLTREKFAASFMEALRRNGVEEPLTYDRDGDRLLVGSGEKQQIVNLVSFFKEYQSLSRAQRKEYLTDRARL